MANFLAKILQQQKSIPNLVKMASFFFKKQIFAKLAKRGKKWHAFANIYFLKNCHFFVISFYLPKKKLSHIFIKKSEPSAKNQFLVSIQESLECEFRPYFDLLGDESEDEKLLTPPPLREWTKPLEKSPFFAQKPTLREWTKIFLIEKNFYGKKFWHINDN
ncbi:unnamed protein product [Blepharisma stoltei]|uniref:Uncharacterized protein n=1 Tax=Blepharisma stoltei TaxID=1481888 RepID=A0AAU9KAR2_9CILI|nr:unnamed protein product [Blepharisma stoltei]